MISRLHYKIFSIVLTVLIAGIVNTTEAIGKKFTVVIDAGHGGKDVGATDNGVMEKNINLKVARELESLVKKKMKDANVVMTRDKDEFLTLQQRADKANKAQGDIFISIHTNSVDKKNPNRKNIEGSSVYTLGLNKDENNLEVAMRENSVIEYEQDYKQKYSGFDPQRDESYIIFEMAQKKNLSRSIQFAEDIEKELVKSGRADRGVHQAGFWVLWATSMPSVLVELDFICNPESAKYLNSDKGAKELAQAIFKALERYEDAWEKMQKETTAPSSSKKTATANNEIVETETTESEEVALARTRTRKKTDTAPRQQPVADSGNGNKMAQSNVRRRRSQQSRELSMNNSYEAGENLIISASSAPAETVEEAPVIASASSTPKVKTKEEKEREKQAKKRAKEEEKRQRAEQKKLAKERSNDSHNAKVNKVVTVYKIQILASGDLLKQENPRFCGLTPISTFKENNMYKYYYGESTNRGEIETMLVDVKKKIPDAFIVTSMKTVKK